METKPAIGSRRIRSFASFAAMVALASLAVLLAQHFTTLHKVLAQDRTPGAHLSGAQDPVLSAQQDSVPDRAAAIIAYDTAVNNGDLDAAMATFASNAVFVGAARGAAGCSQTTPCTDNAGIRQQIQDRNIAIHECFTLRSITVSGDVVSGERYAQSDVTRRNGVAGDVENFLAVIPGSQITFFANVKNVGDPETARDLAISAGTQPAGTPIPTPATPCATAP
jgi:ketosteroid isomerase-like protein